MPARSGQPNQCPPRATTQPRKGGIGEGGSEARRCHEWAYVAPPFANVSRTMAPARSAEASSGAVFRADNSTGLRNLSPPDTIAPDDLLDSTAGMTPPRASSAR